MPAPTDLTPAEQQASDQALDTFVAALGGREQLTAALTVGSGSPEVDRVLRLIDDPRYATWSLRKLCVAAGITVAEFFSAYRKAALVEAHLKAVQIIAGAIPGVVQDLMQRAQPHAIKCEPCNGIGTITTDPTPQIPNPIPQPCRACNGVGTITVLPDLDRQKVALELGTLLQARGGLSIQQNVLTAGSGAAPLGSGGAGALDALQQAVHGLLRPTARALPIPTPASAPVPVVDGILEEPPCAESPTT